MRRLAATSVALLLACGAVSSPARAGLNEDIQKVLGEKLMARTQYGIEVVRLDPGGGAKVVYSKDAGVRRKPASNLKLITTAAALDRLGGGFKFRTKLAVRGSDVVLIGDGDPTLGDAELLAGTGWGTTTVFKHWAQELKKRGITTVNDVIVDDGVFDEVFMHPAWSPEQYAQPHSAEVAGVSINENCVNVTVRGKGSPASYSLDPASRAFDVKNSLVSGSQTRVALTREKGDNTLLLRGQIRSGASATYQCTVHDPPIVAAGALANVLAAEGIQVTGKIARDRAAGEQSGVSVVGVHETPIGVVVKRSNKDSQNLYAESLCKRMGHVATGQPGSWANGTAAVGEYLRKLGIDASEFRLDDGCGLSRNNEISPRAVCRVLAANYYSADRDGYLKSLAVGGVDGTLENRFRDAGLKGKVFAKTGFIEGVTALSGYLRAKDGNTYAFSILINGIPPKSNSLYKEFQERIVRAVNNNVGK